MLMPHQSIQVDDQMRNPQGSIMSSDEIFSLKT